MRPLALVPFLFALASCTSCTSMGGPPAPGQWTSDEITTASERILWEVTVLSLEKHGYPVGTGLDPATMMATSGWRNSMAPFRGEGYRNRAIIRYELVGENRYKIEVRVEHQVNMDITRPLDPRYAKWQPDEDDVAQAGVLLQRIKAWIGGDFDVGERPEPGS